MGAPGCPTPNKRGYDRRQQARKHMWSLMQKSPDPTRLGLHVYLCRCGKHHVGHARGIAA